MPGKTEGVRGYSMKMSRPGRGPLVFARARYGTLILSAFCMACALFAFAPAAAAQGVDVSSTTRLEGVLASIRARDPKAAPGLIVQFAVEPEPGIRAWILRAVAALKAPQGPALFQTGLRDGSPLVRMAAVEVLAGAQGAAAVPDLAAALAGEANAGVRNTIVFWLGTIKTPASTAALRQALSADADPNVRVEAARSLKQQGTGSARQALRAARGDSDARVRGIVDEP